jgi:hypothetical protein
MKEKWRCGDGWARRFDVNDHRLFHYLSCLRISEDPTYTYIALIGIPTVQNTLVNIVSALRLVSFRSLLKLSALEEQ